jgi:hypothetical protein
VCKNATNGGSTDLNCLLKFDQRCQKGCDHLQRTGAEAGEECIEALMIILCKKENFLNLSSEKIQNLPSKEK